MVRHSVHAPVRRRRGGCMMVVGVALLLVGLCLTFYPVVSASFAQADADAALAAWRSSQTASAQVADTAATGEEGYRPKEGDATFEALQAYNEAVSAGTGEAINDPFAFGDDDLAALGLPDGIIGSITVERFGETIPLYLGASQEHMATGAGVVAGTSMPLGGPSTHCVVAAHRGPIGGLTMFRDVETLVPGDLIRLETPWETLCYRVTGYDIVLPNDTAALAPEAGRDLLTLLTCHPYGSNARRYLVRCERDVATEEELRAAGTGTGGAAQVATQVVHAVWPGWSAASPALNIESLLRVAGLAIALMLGIWLIVEHARHGGADRGRRDVPGRAHVGGAERIRRGGAERPGPSGSHFR